ncbi:MAG: hypothetical protein J5669_04945 [Bacteroidales bacterium]|nr:hypothetical protein [Bacteroidales bacterium]
MKKCLSVVLLLACSVAAAQDEEVLRAALYLTGADSAEGADTSIIDLLESRQGRRIRINDNHLRGGGILSDYQVAVIKDYRGRSGDILSWEELALLDGFSPEAVAALKPFLSLDSSRLPGSADTVRVRGQALLRTTLTSVGGKAKASGSFWRAGGAWRGKDGTFYGELTGNRTRWIIGDYNIRFGQGLSMWTGFSMESLSTVDAFVRRPQGAAPVWSYSSGSVLRGIAGEYTGGPLRITAFASLNKTFGARAEWLGRRGQAGITAATQPGAPLLLSADGRFQYKGLLITGELAWKNRNFSGLMAASMPLGEHIRLAMQGRVIPSRYSGKKYGEYALATGLEYKAGRVLTASLTADAALLPIPANSGSSGDPRRYQLRVYTRCAWQISSLWAVEARITERYRNHERPRTAVRTDLRLGSGPWQGTFRSEEVFCEQVGWLGYLEAGRKTDIWAAWARVTGFVIDRWNDRVYCYERDAPGTFSVPAYNGRGGAISLVSSWKHRFRHLTLKAYLRSACVFRQGRTPAPTLNLQLQCEI